MIVASYLDHPELSVLRLYLSTLSCLSYQDGYDCHFFHEFDHCMAWYTVIAIWVYMYSTVHDLQ